MTEPTIDTSKALTARGQFLTTLNQRLGELEPKLKQLLPAYLPPKRFFMIAYDSVVRTPLLQECTIPSILKCVIEASEIGLEVGGPKHHAWLVPFRNKKTGHREAQLIPGYQGLAHLAYDAGGVTKIEGHVVHARDHFHHEASPPTLDHVPFDEACPTCNGLGEKSVTRKHGKDEAVTEVVVCEACKGTARQPRGRAIKYYAVATLTNGDRAFEVMDRGEVEKIRNRSKAKDDGPWVTDFDEMGKKTAFKRLEKWLPKTDGAGAARLARAIELDNQAVGLAEENASAIETTSRPLPHEILEECTHGVPLSEDCEKCVAENEAAEKTKKAEEDKKKQTTGSGSQPTNERKKEEPPSKGSSSPPDDKQASGTQAAAVAQPDPAPATQRESGDEPADGFKTSDEESAATGAEPINPQRLEMLTKTAAAAGLDEMAIAAQLQEFGVGDLRQVTDGIYDRVLLKFARLPVKRGRK